MVLRANVSPADGNRLLQLARTTRSVVTMRRCNVILHSAQGFTPPKIGQMLGVHPDYVRFIIKAWNATRFPSLEPKYSGGRPPKFTEEQRRKLGELSTYRPADLGLPFQEWSLSRLRRIAIDQGIVTDISIEWLRVILHEEALSYQEAKTWKQSNDPDFSKKKAKIERLTRKRHNPPVVVATDEMGPISLTPKKGKGWHPVGEPHRVPAEYHKTKGIQYWFGAFHVAGNRLWGRLEPKKGGVPWLEWLKAIRRDFPRSQRIYIVQDNLSAHWTPEIRSWAKNHKVVLVATATNASWMNPIECRFTELEDLAFSGSDYQRWEEAALALDRAAEYRNTKELPLRSSPRQVQVPLWRRH